MTDTDLCYITASEALARFKARTLSPVELMHALIARADRVEKKVNAFTYRFYERALDAAKRAEAKYTRTDGRPRPLEGLAVAIKDETTIKGERTTFGSLVHKDDVDTRTAPPAELIFQAGAIMIARSTAPEFSCAPICHTRLWGTTRTPWNLAFSSGGSSGGAGAALAAGITTLANGSDIGGSIRIPASACGVYGYKPPYGRNPDSAPFNLDWYNHAGPMARSVADCALLQNVMSGPHPRDIVSIRPRLRIPDRFEPIKGMRIALSIDFGYAAVDPEVEANTRAAMAAFRDLGATVEETELGWTRDAYRAAFAHFGIFGASVARLLPKHSRKLMPYTREFARRGRKVTMTDFLAGMETEGKMYDRLGALFQTFDILICPTLAVPSVKADQDLTDPDFRVNGKKVDAYLEWCLTYPFNMMSRCPVMSVPSGFAKSGVPTGLQIVGRPYDDVAVFRAAAAFERLRPLYDAPERRPDL
ncbi:MAG: amidase [Hyphomicrobium sp.]|uniref:amidase n=1 Tax=Hyphomicrobium sp. TaxID=82 RepID=UPI003D110370